MSLTWKILVILFIVTVLTIAGVMILSSSTSQPQSELSTAEIETTATGDEQPEEQSGLTPVEEPPGISQSDEDEVTYIHGAPDDSTQPEPGQPMGLSDIQTRGIGDRNDGMTRPGFPGTRPTDGTISSPGGEQTTISPEGDGGPSSISSLDDLTGITDIQGISPGTGPGASGASTMFPDGDTQAGLPFDIGSMEPGTHTSPPAGIPLPPTGTAIPSLNEPVPDELDGDAVQERVGKRFILPPIISDDFLTTVIGDKKFTLVYADFIDSDKIEGITELHGNVRIQYKDNVIESEEAIIHKEEDWARFFGEGGVFAKNDDGELRCDELEAHFDTKIAYLTGPVDIIRYANTEDELDRLPDDATKREKIERALKKKETHITCIDAEYAWGDKIVDLHNGVRIEQEDKYVECEELHSENKTEEGLLTGDVVLHQDNGQWLFDEKVITDEDELVTHVVGREKTTVYCDELEYKSEDDWYQLRDNVHGVQPDKEGKCDTLTFDDSEDVHLLTLDKDVWLHQENGDWLFEAELIGEDESDDVKDDARKWATLTCDELLIHTDTEDAEASGSVDVKQEHQKGKSDKAFYKREYDLLHLVGNVEVQREEKNTVFAEEVFLFLTSRIFEARGNVRTTAWMDVDEEQRKKEEEKNKEAEG